VGAPDVWVSDDSSGIVRAHAIAGSAATITATPQPGWPVMRGRPWRWSSPARMMARPTPG